MEAVQRFVRAFTYENMPWREAQEAGHAVGAAAQAARERDRPALARARKLTDVEHPELGRSFRYATSKWIGTANAWAVGRRAPLLNEDAADRDDAGQAHASGDRRICTRRCRRKAVARAASRSRCNGIRILDFTWFLASAGGTRFLSAFGAESIKVELKSHPDTRLAAMAPVGGREARDKATAPLPGVTDPNMGGQFNNKNPGKRGISLNVRHPKGLEIAKRLVAMSDIVAEGFSPGVLDSWGLGYDGAEGDQTGHHLRAAVGHGRAGHLRPLPHRRARSRTRSPGCPRCRDCPSRRCRPAGATRTSTGWAPTVSRWRC